MQSCNAPVHSFCITSYILQYLGKSCTVVMTFKLVFKVILHGNKILDDLQMYSVMIVIF